MFKPSFNWHFSKPELYKRGILEFWRQPRHVGDVQGKERHERVRDLIQEAEGWYHRFGEAGIDFDSDSDGSHLPPWMTVANQLAQGQGVEVGDIALEREQDLVAAAISNPVLRDLLEPQVWPLLLKEPRGLFDIRDVVCAIVELDEGRSVCGPTSAMEMKLRNWRRALKQALRYRSFARRLCRPGRGPCPRHPTPRSVPAL